MTPPVQMQPFSAIMASPFAAAAATASPSLDLFEGWNPEQLISFLRVVDVPVLDWA